MGKNGFAYSTLVLVLVLWLGQPANCQRAAYPLGNVTKQELVAKYYEGKSLGPVEGIWAEADGTYEIAVIKGAFADYPGYEYIGLITSSKVDKFKPGLVKALLRKTADTRKCPGVWYLRNFEEQPSLFTVSADHNTMTCKWNDGYDSTLTLLRVYPDDNVAGPGKSEERSGTGFFVSSSLVVTSAHVIGTSKRIRIVTDDGASHEVQVLVRDDANDIALIKVRDTTVVAYLRVSDPTTVTEGNKAFTIGFPLPGQLGSRSKVAEGIVNGVTGLRDDPRLFQISVPVQPGNSGGPVLNENGRVIGIVASTVNPVKTLGETGTLPQNVNFAVKINYLSNLVAVAREKLPEPEALQPAKLDASGIADMGRKSVVQVIATETNGAP